MSKKIQNKNKYNNPDIKHSEAKKTPKWFYAVPFLLPVIFFILLEILLRIFNYGTSYEQWIDLTDKVRIMNPEYTRKYFHTTSAVPYPNGNSFDINKADNAYRVFILGESSAAGYPYSPNGDFGKYIRKRLELDYPDKKIEVVNLGITAINSFTIRDLLPGILEQKPDLLLIYTGHNEYYGALGVGSIESFGSSRWLVNATLWLEGFRTTQLIRNILKSAAGLFSKEEQKTSGTLMSRMAKDQYIQLDSEVFNKGLEQFEGNLSDIISMANDEGVKVVLSTLSSNLKDQPPFISTKSASLPKAADIYNQALSLLSKDSIKANQLFRYAKDLDALRFRAPEKMNSLIKRMGKENNIPVVDADRIFADFSPFGITGDNLMVDHLHPTLDGYQLLGRGFYNQMKLSGILPKIEAQLMSEPENDRYVIANYNFSHLDSVLARYRIIILKNDWPFRENSAPTSELLNIMNPADFFDTLALKVTQKTTDWELAHRQAAEEYVERGDLYNYTEEMLVLIDQFPFIERYYTASEYLLGKEQFDLAYKILLRKDKIYPDAFTTKWIGTIALNKGDLSRAIKYLSKAAETNKTDAQILYNLAGAYYLDVQFKNALITIDKCLSVDPSFPGAAEFRNQVLPFVK